MNLGQIVKNYREANRMTIDDFVLKSGLSKGYVSMLENNKNPKTGNPIIPSLETIKKVSKAIGKNINDLIEELDKDQEIKLTPINDADEIENYDSDYKMLPKNRLESLRITKGLTREDIAKYLDTTVDTVAKFEMSIVQPSSNQFEKLSELLNRPIKFITGQSDSPIPIKRETIEGTVMTQGTEGVYEIKKISIPENCTYVILKNSEKPFVEAFLKALRENLK